MGLRFSTGIGPIRLSVPLTPRRRRRRSARRTTTVRSVNVGQAALANEMAMQRRAEAKAQRRARRDAQITPMPPWIWAIWAVFAVTALISSPPAIPGMLIIGICIFGYQRARAQRVARNTAPPVPAPITGTGFEEMARTYDRMDMPESARAYRDLAEIYPEQPNRAGHQSPGPDRR
jgi:hypothetical protein